MNAPRPAHEFALSFARLKMMKRDAAGLFAEIGYSLAHIADDTIPTLCTDGRELRYNPAFCLALTEDTLQTALAHEYAHVALMHPIRYKPHHQQRRANIAMDHAVNLMLVDAGFSIPKDWHCNPQFAGMAWEHIYTLLPEDPPQDAEQPQCEPFAVGPGQPGEVQGDVRPYPGKGGQPATEDELSAAQAELTDRLFQIAQAMAQAGRDSAAARRIVQDMTTPRDPDLYEALARLLERSADDHTWRRINRRLLHAGLFPGIDGEQCPPLVIAVDTSGSISEPILSAFQDKVRRAIADFRPRAVTVIYCDSAINEDPQTFEPDAFPGLHPVGGGGTHFAPPFEWVDAHMAEAPAALVYLTDLDGPMPDHPPGYPVIWARIPGYRHRTAPWGDTIPLNL